MIVWKLMEQHRYGPTPYQGFVGNLKQPIFSISYDSVRGTKHPDGTEILNCTLPGIKEYIGNFKTREDAIERAEKVWAHWMNLTGVQPMDKS